MCRAFCNTNADCGSRSFCELPLGTSGLMMCTQACNPVGIGAGCPPGMACYVFDSEHTDCRLPGTAYEGQSASSQMTARRALYAWVRRAPARVCMSAAKAMTSTARAGSSAITFKMTRRVRSGLPMAAVCSRVTL